MMAKDTREIIRFGLPVSVEKLYKILEAVNPPDRATVRYYNGCLIIEEPALTLEVS